jgi:hypothetical protein
MARRKSRALREHGVPEKREPIDAKNIRNHVRTIEWPEAIR